MKGFIKSKRGIALLVTLVVVGASAFGAYAYFTTSGTGTGHVTVGSLGGNNFTVTSPADTLADLIPSALTDLNAVVDTVDYSVVNDSESDVNVNSVTFSIPASFSDQANGSLAACTASDFSINGATPGVSVTVSPPDAPLGPHSDGAPGDTYGSSYTLQLVENGANQDNCEGVVVPITIAAS